MDRTELMAAFATALAMSQSQSMERIDRAPKIRTVRTVAWSGGGTKKGAFHQRNPAGSKIADAAFRRRCTVINPK